MLAFDRDQLNEVINLVESNQKVAISINLPKNLLFKNIANIEDAYRKISELSSTVTYLAKSAFIDNNKNSLSTIQFLLYYWNYRDLLRIERVLVTNVYSIFQLLY